MDPATLRGIVAMVVALFAFVMNDSFVKVLSEELPLGEIIFIRGLFALFGVVLLVHWRGEWPSPGVFVQRPVLLRNLGELGGTVCFLTALTQLPIANATAILQALPLAVTAAAAILLGEAVGWRRWCAVAVGFIGVMLIVRPGTEGFNAYSIYAVIAVGFITLRDMATRFVPHTIPTFAITLSTTVTILCLSLVMGLFETWTVPSGRQMILIMSAASFLLVAYIFAIRAMREGEVSVIAPFRYTIILWALVIDFVVWGTIPTWLTGIGIAVVVASGLYTFFRERRMSESAS